ncbi:DUF1559 domain-containing protein [Roseiconus lacunae]|uniref:DUF1559 family PulG-like putative transporter n=1 Tax=Roseiconus lacunae TaxID=2605694 RepID=UPI00308BC48A|nr:DUF1559 domain-containing protein [Stieleria sp. HD01]
MIPLNGLRGDVALSPGTSIESPNGKRVRENRWRHLRHGLTLIELLTVIAVLSVLGALLLPAVSEAREAARRMQCSGKMRQMGVALHAYHGAHSRFPPGHLADLKSGGDGRSWGWGTLLLPFIEQRSLADQLRSVNRSFDEVASDESRSALLQTNIDLYQCPSDTGDSLSHPYRSILVPITVMPESSSFADGPSSLTTPDHAVKPPPPPPPPPEPPPVEPQIIYVAIRLGKSNYVGSIGSRWKTERSDWDVNDFRGNGVFGRNSDLTIAEIFDGMSNTLAIGERCMRNYSAVWAGSNSWQGCGFVDNQMMLGTAFYPINDSPVRQNIDCDGQGSANFSSYHGGGANFLLADGAVRYLTEHIDIRVFQNLAQRDDGEKVGDF